MKKKSQKKNPRVFSDEEEPYAEIIGFGSAWGDMRGKVKTRQIGFIRDDRRRNKTSGKGSRAKG